MLLDCEHTVQLLNHDGAFTGTMIDLALKSSHNSLITCQYCFNLKVNEINSRTFDHSAQKYFLPK